MLPCSAADFAGAKGMNAKARKKEKRHMRRYAEYATAALQTMTATEDAAQDAATSSAKEPSKTSPSSFQKEETARCNTFVNLEQQRMLPNAFVAAVSKLLIDYELHGVDSLEEFNIVKDIVIDRVLPQVAQGLLDRRAAQKQGAVITKVDAVVRWVMENDKGQDVRMEHTTKEANKGASTQDPETIQDEAQQGSAQPGQQPPEGSVQDNADQANATTSEEKGLWDIATEKAALEGGSAVKIFQAMKKKSKAKEKKQALIAA